MSSHAPETDRNIATNRLSAIQLGAPGEEISKKDLYVVSQRFKAANFGRLQRLQEFFHGRQRDFLNLLPLLFHINHPLLPGFVSLDTPAGIPEYLPNKQTVTAAKQFSKGFAYKPKALRIYPIYGIYLMGSVGSIAFSRDSDIDIWLCHQPGLGGGELDELRKKAKEVEHWAATLSIEVHFFLIDPEQLKRGENAPISAESCGTTQHYLLLEEFYRTSIYIAGRIPAWWLVPPGQEMHYEKYVSHLLENRFISSWDVIDFGGLENMPMSEFLSATLWEIYKSLASPHKSLLKLLLMESYACEFPQPQWLCVTMKQAVYRGRFSADDLDPYLMIYRKVENYLQQDGSLDRLNLARECFYLKIMGSGRSVLDGKTRQSREDYLLNAAERWSWPEGFAAALGGQKFWTIQKATVENAVIRTHLQNCMRMILKIAGNPLDHTLSRNRELQVISRKLRASLDVVPGKVEVLVTRKMVHAAPDVLSFVEPQHQQVGVGWRLYTQYAADFEVSPGAFVKECACLTELLCWCAANGLYKKHTSPKLVAAGLKLDGSELSLLLQEIDRFLQCRLISDADHLDRYERPNRYVSSLLLVNLGENLPIDANGQQLVMSERSDPLSYGDNRQCFVQSAQRISVSGWQEVTVQEYRGLSGLFDCLTEVFNDSETPAVLNVVCLTKVRGRSIAARIDTLFGNLLKTFTGPAVEPFQRYVLAGEGGYYLFRCRDGILDYAFLENQQQLLLELGSAQIRHSPVRFDAFVLEQSFIPLLYGHDASGKVQIFYHSGGKQIEIYVIDEKGALFYTQHGKGHPEHVLVQYLLFLNTLLVQAKLPAAESVECYEIQKNSAGVVSCHPVQVKPSESVRDLRVRIAYEPAGGAYCIYCNDLKFLITDQETYAAVRNQILSFRKHQSDYPVHITEIEVPCRLLGIESANQAQAVHFLRYKQKIEDKLNIRALPAADLPGGDRR